MLANIYIFFRRINEGEARAARGSPHHKTSALAAPVITLRDLKTFHLFLPFRPNGESQIRFRNFEAKLATSRLYTESPNYRY